MLARLAFFFAEPLVAEGDGFHDDVFHTGAAGEPVIGVVALAGAGDDADVDLVAEDFLEDGVGAASVYAFG